MNQFQIPSEYASRVTFVPTQDTRSDDEIITALSLFSPITSEKNIWTFWHNGVQNMPNWCKQNICNWIRLCGPSWTVRVLDKIPDSPNYALKHIPNDLLPDSFVHETMEGPYVGPHSADICRGAYLYTYGGAWIDVGVILLRPLNSICWDKLSDPASPFEVCIPWMYENSTANHFVASRKGDPFIKRWHELFVHLWRDRISHEGIIDHPLLKFSAEKDYSKSQERGFRWQFEVDTVTTLNYLAQVLVWMRLSAITDTGDEERFDGHSYWMNRVLLLDALEECWGAESQIGFEAQKLFDLLCTRTDDGTSKGKEARDLVWRLLSKSSLQKFAHAKNIWKGKSIGAILDAADHENFGLQSGTFWEILRYGSANFHQTREIEYVPAPEPAALIREGLYEAL